MAGSVAIVGAGQIGRAACQVFTTAGWDVTVLARTSPAWPLGSGRFRRHLASQDATPDCDVLLDTIAFDSADIAPYDCAKVQRLIVVSSASVYCDSAGRTLDEAAKNGFPQFGGPLTEGQQTVEPGPETYSTRKVRMEQAARARFGRRATVLRPCAIHGPWSRHPREWWFVKRIADGRRIVPLAHNGESRFQTTAVSLLAEASERAASRGIGGTFNIADDGAPSVKEIAHSIADSMGVGLDLVGFVGSGSENGVGRTPWSIPRPIKISSARAISAFDLSPLPYSVAVAPSVDWLAESPPTDWRTAYPQLAAYPWKLFDYAAEDCFLAGMGGAPVSVRAGSESLP